MTKAKRPKAKSKSQQRRFDAVEKGQKAKVQKALDDIKKENAKRQEADYDGTASD